MEDSGASSSASWNIAAVVGKFEAKDEDCQIVKYIAALDKFDVEKMFYNMDTEKMQELKQLSEKYKRFAMGDTSIRAYAAVLDEMLQIEYHGFEKTDFCISHFWTQKLTFAWVIFWTQKLTFACAKADFCMCQS